MSLPKGLQRGTKIRMNNNVGNYSPGYPQPGLVLTIVEEQHNGYTVLEVDPYLYYIPYEWANVVGGSRSKSGFGKFIKSITERYGS